MCVPMYIQAKKMKILMAVAIFMYVILLLLELIHEYVATEPWVGVVMPGIRLGNQLWILASSHAIAKSRNARWCVIGFKGSAYESHIQWTSPPPEDCPGRLSNIVLLKLSILFKVIDIGDSYAAYHDKYLVDPYPRIMLTGYLQSFKYFYNNKTKTVPFSLTSSSDASRWVNRLGITTAIHIRRGDRVDIGIDAMPPLRYYELAMRQLQSRFPLQRYVIVTEDPIWVRSHSLFDNMTVLSSSNPSFDMAVISECKHKIISVGTFGWWGAFLNDRIDNTTSVVMYPALQIKRGKDNGEFKPSDYFPEHWTSVDYEKQEYSKSTPQIKRSENVAFNKNT